MREAARKIARFIDCMTLDEFMANEMAQAAVMYQMAVFGEAANRTSNAGKANHPAVPWAELIHQRNFYIHGYDHVRYRQVWHTVTTLVPEVEKLLDAILAERDKQ